MAHFFDPRGPGPVPQSPKRSRSARRNESSVAGAANARGGSLWLADSDACRFKAQELERLRLSQRFFARAEVAASHICGARLDVQTEPIASRRGLIAPPAPQRHVCGGSTSRSFTSRDVIFNWSGPIDDAHPPAQRASASRDHVQLSDFACGQKYSNGAANCIEAHSARRRVASPRAGDGRKPDAPGHPSEAAPRASTPTLNFSRAQRLSSMRSGPLW